MSTDQKWVYMFGDHAGLADPKGTLGGKGYGLAEMKALNLPIPFGFTITSQACNAYQQTQNWPSQLEEQVNAAIAQLEATSGKKFGDKSNPLLVSVRSGAKISMPGMMDTVLNLGLSDELVDVLAQLTQNERFAYDSYRRFIFMFSDVVMGLSKHDFDVAFDAKKKSVGATLDTDLTAEDLKDIVTTFKSLYERGTGHTFPQTHQEQLRLAINAVFESWNNSRAKAYRQLNNIPDDLGTAVNVQEMVFGNMGNDSATGVAFTRNPATGEKKYYGEYLCNAQGEDVVAGIRTPLSLDTMKEQFPQPTQQLYDIFVLLEKHFQDMQDIEFTIEKNKLYLLQTRNGKRTAAAAVYSAVEMVHEGLITKEQAVDRIDVAQLDSLLHKQFDPKQLKQASALTTGLAASPGAGVGQVVFTAEDAVAWAKEGKQVVLVREETSPEDILGMAVSQGILTTRGGQTSHAAVVARGMNVCCVCGAGQAHISAQNGVMTIGTTQFKQGDFISLDGSTGNVYQGSLAVIDPTIHPSLKEFLQYCDDLASVKIRANADTPHDAQVALDYGATGIGLVRTEHMFFDPHRINVVREMIVATTTEQRVKALDKLLPYQVQDFAGIFNVMGNLPVVIRLIDPPLHEFLPKEDRDIVVVANELNVDVDVIKATITQLHECNPMLGFRGVRLGIVFPEINQMQVKAIFHAALQLKEKGFNPNPCIEIPLAGDIGEIDFIYDMIKQIAQETGAQDVINYEIGTMIEVPRAALLADEFASKVDFFSFGTNDLTQMTCGFSRDDSGRFLQEYVKKGIYQRDPFASIDERGVGKLMDMCVSMARQVKPNIDVGICGEHGGDPQSIAFCHKIGLDNVSCSPFRVPVARLAAAQAALAAKK